MIKELVLFSMSIFDYFHQRKIIIFLKKKNLKRISIFLDVGAHKGESINLFSKNMEIKKVISFEASPKNFEFLKKKKDYYSKKFPNTEIIIENIALGSENKEKVFKQFNESSSSTLNDINEKSKYFKNKFKLLNFLSNKKIYETFKVQVKTLNDYLEKNIINKVDFLKIDTEGYEYEILKGLESKIDCVDFIMFEHHYDNMIKKNYTFLDINHLLIRKNFKQIYKSKMPFRKTFEYIYCKS
jgi:FkbM family methyltransferase